MEEHLQTTIHIIHDSGFTDLVEPGDEMIADRFSTNKKGTL